jgi:hypothetical protein
VKVAHAQFGSTTSDVCRHEGDDMDEVMKEAIECAGLIVSDHDRVVITHALEVSKVVVMGDGTAFVEYDR